MRLHRARTAVLVAGSGLALAIGGELVTEERSLRLAGDIVKGSLTAGESATVCLALDAGEYARVEVESDCDLALRLLPPGGEPAGEIHEPGAGFDMVSLVTVIAGEHRLLLRPADAGCGGPFTAELAELRPASTGDTARLAADRDFHRAESLYLLWKKRFSAGGGGAADERTMRAEASDSYAAARERYREAGTATWEARSLQRLGWLTADAAAAEPLYREAIAVCAADDSCDRRLGPNLYRNLSSVLSRLGKLEEAATALDAAEALAAGSGPPADSSLLMTRSELRRKLGESAAAVSDAEEAVRRCRQAECRAKAHNALALALRDRGEYELARSSFLAALETGVPQGADEAAIRTNLGIVALDLGRPTEALEQLELALTLLGDGRSLARVSALRERGVARARLEDFDGALEDLEQAHRLALEHEEGGGTRSGEVETAIAKAERQLGSLLVRLDRPQEAVTLLEAALDRRRGGGLQGLGMTLADLGQAYLAAGRLDDARRTLDEALTVQSELEDPLLVSQVHYRLARLDQRAGDLAAAQTALERALAAYESVRAGLAADRLRVRFLAAGRRYYEVYVDLLAERARRAPGAGFAAQALEASERGRARGLADLVARVERSPAGGDGRVLAASEQRLGQVLADIEGVRAALGASGDAARKQRLLTRLGDLRQEHERLESALETTPPGGAGRSTGWLPAGEIQQLLAPGQVLLEYSLGEDASHLFVVRRDGLAIHPLPPEPEIREPAVRLRRALAAPGPFGGGWQQDARALYELLVAPAAGELAAAERLLVSPDGPLWTLPFEALLVAEDGFGDGDAPGEADGEDEEQDFLIERRPLAYVPSATVLASLEKRRRGLGADAGPVVVFAAPDYATPAASPAPVAATRSGELPWAPLHWAHREAERVAEVYGSQRVVRFEGAEASEDRVKNDRRVAAAAVLHFATHGFVDPELPERSGLALSRGPGEDGNLLAYEIFNLPLAAEVVVLSACDTGRGEQVAGEGVLGLTRAFLWAGAGSVLVSLWPVDDRVTADLMYAFHRHLRDSHDPAEALRRAKMSLLDSPFTRSPRLWAPFVLVGPPGGPAGNDRSAVPPLSGGIPTAHPIVFQGR